MIKINPNIFDKVYRELIDKDQRTQIIFGGGSSGKSYSMMQYAVIWAIEGRNTLVIRKTAVSLKVSVWTECLLSIERLNLSDSFHINRTDKIITCKISGGCIMFKGIDDQERIKSIRSVTDSAIDTVIVDEATELFPDDIRQLKIRQRGTSKFKKRIILVFNPIHKQHHIYKSYFADLENFDKRYEDPRLFILKTTYLDNTHLDE
jgi:phage terminase large subunit